MLLIALVLPVAGALVSSIDRFSRRKKRIIDKLDLHGFIACNLKYSLFKSDVIYDT